MLNTDVVVLKLFTQVVDVVVLKLLLRFYLAREKITNDTWFLYSEIQGSQEGQLKMYY